MLVLDTWVVQVGNNNSNGLFTRELTLNTTFLRRKLQELREKICVYTAG